MRLLRQTVRGVLNLEMAATDEMVRIAREVKPDVVTLVPEKRAGAHHRGRARRHRRAPRPAWRGDRGARRATASRSACSSTRRRRRCAASKELGAPRIELHTGDYCETLARAADARRRRGAGAHRALRRVRGAELGLHVAAGHGLDYGNVGDGRRHPRDRGAQHRPRHRRARGARRHGARGARDARGDRARAQGARVILGIGVDLTPVEPHAARLRRAPRAARGAPVHRRRARLLPRAGAEPAQHFAARFAAKEALLKALRVPEGLRWHELEVVSDGDGAPRFRLTRQRGRARRRSAGVRALHLSITHADDAAMAFVVAEG